jgi:hypothetical protein
VRFYAYLPSAEEYSLNSAFGSVHELGTFFAHLQTYWLNLDDMRADEKAAAEYTLTNAKLLILKQ